MEELPIDLFIQQITYLPFNNVTTLCQSNQKFHRYCTDPKYSDRWRRLIEDTFSNSEGYLENLKLLLDRFGEYNYHVYTNFVKLLDPITQGMIYYKQKDIDSFNNLTDRQRVLVLFLLGDIKQMKNSFPKAQDYLDLLEGKPMRLSALNRILVTMIDEGSIAGVKFMLNQGVLITDDVVSLAIRKDRYDILKYIMSREKIDKNFALGIARAYGKDKMAELLMK